MTVSSVTEEIMLESAEDIPAHPTISTDPDRPHENITSTNGHHQNLVK
jgi:hypothetical protein